MGKGGRGHRRRRHRHRHRGGRPRGKSPAQKAAEAEAKRKAEEARKKAEEERRRIEAARKAARDRRYAPNYTYVLGDMRVALDEDRDSANLARMIAGGGDVEEKFDHGWTPLLYACTKGLPDCARVLVEAGANINAARDWNYDKDIMRPLHHACTSWPREMFYDRLGCARVLLEAGADVNAETANKETALHLACDGPWHNGGRLDFIHMLVQAGADLSATNKVRARARECGGGRRGCGDARRDARSMAHELYPCCAALFLLRARASLFL